MKNLILTTVFAFVGMALIETSASAQTASTGDLILAFAVNDGLGQGATTNLEVDLGNNPLSLNVGNLNVNDLINTYGANWSTRGDLVWAVVGTKGAPTNETFLTSAITTPTESPTLSFASNLTPLYAGFNSGTLASNSNTITIGTGTAGSFTYQQTNNGAFAAGSDFNTGYSVTQSVPSSGSLSIALYDLVKHGGTTTPGTNDGSVNLSSSGVLSFTPAAVPEPSTYALIALGAGVMLLMRRRIVNS